MMAKPISVYSVKRQRPRFKILIYAEQGVGKTTFCSTAQDHPAMRDVLIGDVEGGTLSIAHRDHIKRRPIRTTQDLAELAWAIARGEFPKIQTLAVDNITELQNLNLQENVRRDIASGRNTVKGRPRTEDDIWQENYLASTMQLRRIFRMLKDLPINIILTAHLKRVYPKVAEGTDLSTVQPISVVPSLTQKLMESVMGYVDFVWCLEQETEEYDENEEKNPDYGKRFAITVSKGIYKCKTRGPKFLKAIGEVVENPTLPVIYDTFVRTSTSPAKKRSA
jgi:hypothetical protein